MKNLGILGRLRRIRRDLYALFLALRDPRVPRVAKFVIGVVMAYALSPIDLIPDFIPVLGWLDDLVIVPAGIWLAIRLVPRGVWMDCQVRALRERRRLKRSALGAAFVVLIWIAIVVGVMAWYFD